MVGTTDAIIASSEGRTIKSSVGTVYKPGELNAEAIGKYAATFDSGVVSGLEIKGLWTVIEEAVE